MSLVDRYLLWFANENVDFRLPEIESISTLFHINLKWIDGPNESPFWVVETSAKNVEKIASRSITLRFVIKLWGYGKTLEDLHRAINAYPKEEMMVYLKSDLSFRVDVETFGKTCTMKQKVDKIEYFDYLPAMGPVKLNEPDVNLYYIEYYGLKPVEAPDKPFILYFGVKVCEGQRSLISQYSLKTRKFIGNTTMDPQLSLIMANQALVKKGDIVIDPFVGTGSLLVAAAHFGAYVLGVDIDYLMLHGRTRPSRKQDRHKPREKDESVYSNMKQYRTQSRYLDVIVGDSSLPLWHDKLKLDSIITDPPYGIREATERIGSDKEYKINPKHIESHIPSKINYNMSQIFIDLMLFAVKHLKLRGRLVSWIPVVKADYKPSDLPCHPCLKVVSNSEQLLSKQMSRRLLTWEKISESNNGNDCVVVNKMFPKGFGLHGYDQGETRKQRRARIAQDLAERGLTYKSRNQDRSFDS